ncbi:MAG: iron ABC transporter substrate-binding protein [Candidatus Brocadia carolinensis]|uniref:Iron ABC transporter substrate-binding protein n=1 Tax=Candidatus Brocadia carolinensis TaxID=1004156 RepID=A0A1V4ASL2_9BACT|nr:MAG: iron ABC transporter substrate-binding protein [Candidatus Brocadia caroliniensis]
MRFITLIIFVPLLFLKICLGGEVIVYTSEDKVFSEPILQQFEKKTGIKVRAIYDTEETKSTGLVNRLIAEKGNPRADVFWSGDPVRPVLLEMRGITTPYISSAAADIPKIYKDAEGHWTGFSARARIILYNTNLVTTGEKPLSLFDLTKPKWRGQVAIANPLFGTTSIHMAFLFITLGDEKAKKFLQDLKANGVKIVSSNGEVKRLVARGEVMAGLTDTDDANVAIREGSPVKIVFPDQTSMGTLIMPNMVCLIKNGPNPENGKKLIDYLVSKEVEKSLAWAPCAQMPLRYDVRTPADVLTFDAVKGMNVNYHDVAKKLEEIGEFLKQWAGQ